MPASKPADDLSISLGVEEEFFLIDQATLDLVADPDPGILRECARHGGPHRVVPEFMRSQIETNTKVCQSVAEIRQALLETRQLIIAAAEKRGAAALAASTHPFAAWQAQAVTKGRRYRDFAVIFQQSVREMVVGGMHIHAGFGDPDSRIRVMTALRGYLPLFHALTGSSPFSGGLETGYKSFRLAILGSLPRTGLPRPLQSWAEFEQLVSDYRQMKFITDPSELWWDIRPSAKFGTVELRICDVCQRMEEAVAVTALYACLVRNLARLDLRGALPAEPRTEIIAENRWLARRYGVFAFFGDPLGGGRIDIIDYASCLVDELAEDARALRCEAELQGVLDIIRDGSGADRQVDHYRLRRLEGDTKSEALRSVVSMVAAETKDGVNGRGSSGSASAARVLGMA